MLLGFGDDGTIYCIGVFGRHLQDRTTVRDAAEVFAAGKLKPSFALSFLRAGNYIRNFQESPFGKGTGELAVSLVGIRETHYGKASC